MDSSEAVAAPAAAPAKRTRHNTVGLAKASGRYDSAGLTELEGQLFDMAKRISDNRVSAGLHFPMDNVAGAALGLSIADLILHRADLSQWAARQETWPNVNVLPKLRWLAGRAVAELRLP